MTNKIILTVTRKPDINKIYLYVTDSIESKHQLLINRREKLGIKKLKHPEALSCYLQIIYDVLENENLEDYNPTKKRNMLIVYIVICHHNLISKCLKL